MIRNPLPWMLAAFVGATFIPDPCLCAPNDLDPKGLHLLESVAKAYQALPHYTDQGEFTSIYKVDGKAVKIAVPVHVTLSRPNKWKVDAGEVRAVSDGKNVTSVVLPYKKFSVEPASSTIGLETFRQGALGSVLFGGPQGATAQILFELLADERAVNELTKGGTPRQEEDRNVDGTTYQSLLIDRATGPDLRLLIDPKTLLLRAIDWVVDPRDLAADIPPGRTLIVERIGWSSGVIATEAPKDDAFAFSPPAGFSRVEEGDRKRPDAPKSPILELMGKPAPEFTLTVFDGPGKTRTISKADLAGKVVLLDFWATWCPPCLEELPDVQKLIESLDQGKKEAVVIALSVDQRPRELAELRTLIEKTLRDHKFDLGASKAGLVGLDPSGAVGESFQVEAIPSLVILDAKGVVQSAYVGKQERETLAKDIDTLLEGKSLLAPKGDALPPK